MRRTFSTPAMRASSQTSSIFASISLIRLRATFFLLKRSSVIFGAVLEVSDVVDGARSSNEVP